MHLWTSEAVSSGHPDKLADQVADALLDAYLTEDPHARVACEVTITKDLVLVTGEITSKAEPNVKEIVRKTICDVGYGSDDLHFNGHTVEILDKINTQSPQISKAVHQGNEIGAGDQGIMFGFACDETPHFMPLSHALSFAIIDILEKDRRESTLLRPDAKSQVTIQYDGPAAFPRPVRVDTIVVSTCHSPYQISLVRSYVMDLLQDKLPFVDKRTKWVINPAGEWTMGGPAADTGLSGRKIVVDNYGADCPIGGGSFSGKDPTKVDRSGAYAARHIAKNLVAAKLAKRATVQLSYAIGVIDPISVRVQTPDYAEENQFTDMVRQTVDLTPRGILERLDLRRPIYLQTASGGHFGRDGFPWEELNLIDLFQESA